MVVCKYYRQGHCRLGEYCQFDHVNTFGNNNKVDSYNEDEYTAGLIAREVLEAENGGQWLLSCFAPLKDRPCIPGLEDLSPEEVRWEMYQAQKNGMVEQAKQHFQQLCQDVKTKLEALKNPTRETFSKLKEILGTAPKSSTNDSASAKTSSFSFATPQLGTQNSTSSNVFGNKTFGNQSNPFSGNFTSSGSTSIFGRATTTTNTVFGTTPSFGSNLGVFGSGTNTNSIFGGTTNTSTFNTGQNTQTFVSSGSIFSGGNTQSVFGQPTIFGATNQANNVFARAQTSQPVTSVFNSAPTSSSSLFSSTSTQSSNTSIFGGTKTTTANLFGGSSNSQTTKPVFGTTPSPAIFTPSIFSQAKAPAFGEAPAFGNSATFGNASTTIFGEKPAFDSPANSANIFGGATTTTSTFSAAQPTNAFGVTTTTSATNIFGGALINVPTISTSNTTPAGTSPSTNTSPFATATSQLEPNSTTVFSKPTFGTATGSTGEAFGTAVTSSSTPFSAASAESPFGTSSITTPFTQSTFKEVKCSVFGPIATDTNSSTLQQASPFGTFAQSQTSNTMTVSGKNSFGKSPFDANLTVTVINDSVYSIQGQLTDDEKSMYLAEKFTFGKIPLKPPTKDIR